MLSQIIHIAYQYGFTHALGRFLRTNRFITINHSATENYFTERNTWLQSRDNHNYYNCTMHNLLTHAYYTQDTLHGTEAAWWQQTVHKLRQVMLLVLSAFALSLTALVSVQANGPINDADTYNTDNSGAKRYHIL